MNPLLENKLEELNAAEKFECWYLVKHATDFDKLCYLVTFLKEYQTKKIPNKNLETFIQECVAELNNAIPNLSLSNNYRALRVAAFFGLITMSDNGGYENAKITETYDEITNRCSGKYENIDLYKDIIRRQIEKIYISSPIDEEYNGIRRDFRLFPVVFLYKILLEIGKATGEYFITINEYRYIVATSKTYDSFLNALLLIKLLREEPNVNSEFEKFRDKFDNRMNKAIELLDTIEKIDDKYILKQDKIGEINAFVYSFENNDLNLGKNDNYLNFLGSTKPLIRHISDRETDDKIKYLSPEWFQAKAKEEQITYPEQNELIGKISQEFIQKYGYQNLRGLEGRNVLDKLFKTDLPNKDYLINVLENGTDEFGKIGAASSYVFGLYYSESDKSWIYGKSASNAERIDEDKAIEIGTNIKTTLIKACEIIRDYNFTTNTEEDYIGLYNQLKILDPDFNFNRNWVIKYFQMNFPDIFPNFYSPKWLKHILYALQIKPSEHDYALLGQVKLFIKKCAISNIEFGRIIYNEIGEPPRSIYRLGSGEKDNTLAIIEDWKQNNYVSIGWNDLGDLVNFKKDDSSFDKEKIKEKLLATNPTYDNKTASKKANEIKCFLTANNVYNIVANGKHILGVCKFKNNDYYFDSNRIYNHCRDIEWIRYFDTPFEMPINTEGLRTTYSVLKEDENLLYLYKQIFYNKKFESGDKYMSIKYETGLQTKYEHNRILFGAPGTGKSHTLNEEKNDLLGTDSKNYERVTFHPDYSYANFVGTYKPVPCKDNCGNNIITYKYVPGPFMRIYVEALKNAQTNNPKPYLLIIEEINRANVSAVFGDVFQLLDRQENNISEYPIQASEDMKEYLFEKLGGNKDDYKEIRIPDNMLIWATMNSADQGVYPMDTAFKRRWHFTYLSIDENETLIENYIIGKDSNGKEIKWNALRHAINEKLIDLKVNEDKLLGPFFVNLNNIATNGIIDTDKFNKVFKNKILMYLYEDAAKQKRSSLFADNLNSYSQICDMFDSEGINIFCSDIIDKISKD